MEIKTCEQYVLNLLEENQNEVARQGEVIQYLNQKIGALTEKLEALQNLICENATYYTGDNYDWFNISIWNINSDEDNEFGGLLELVPKLKEKISLHTSEKDV